MLRQEIEKQHDELLRFEQAKEQKGQETLKQNIRYYQLLEEIKIKDNLINEFTKKSQEVDLKIKQ